MAVAIPDAWRTRLLGSWAVIVREQYLARVCPAQDGEIAANIQTAHLRWSTLRRFTALSQSDVQRTVIGWKRLRNKIISVVLFYAPSAFVVLEEKKKFLFDSADINPLIGAWVHPARRVT